MSSFLSWSLSSFRRTSGERRDLFFAVALLALVLVAYLPVLKAGFVWDDDSYLTANRNLHDLPGLERIWLSPTTGPQYYPLVFTSFWIERKLWGLHPLGFHLVNLLLHATAAILVWQVLQRFRIPGARATALLFAVHPIMVESVAWVTERKNVLSAVFYLAAVLAYLRFLESSNGRRRAGRYGVVFFLFLAALLSKTVAATLPAALAVLLWWRSGRWLRREWLPLLPLLVPAAVFGALTAWLERTHVGAQGESWALSAGGRVIVAGKALWFYAGKLIWPAELTFIYPRWDPNPSDLASWIAPAGAALVFALLWAFHRRIGRGPLAGALFFAGTLFPALGFFDVYPFRFSFVADHFQYLASLGLLAIAGGAAARRVTSVPFGFRRYVAGSGLLVIAVLAGLTARQSRIYANEETLWRDTLRKNPAAWMAHTNLGAYLDRHGRIEEAIAHHAAAVRLRPDLAGGHNNLAVALEKARREEEAIGSYLAALQLEPRNPEFGRNLANLLARLGRYGQAEACYREVLRLRPTDDSAANNLAHVILRQGRAVEAEEILRALLQRAPGMARAWANLALALEQQGRARAADEARRRAEALDPSLEGLSP